MFLSEQNFPYVLQDIWLYYMCITIAVYAQYVTSISNSFLFRIIKSSLNILS